MEQYRFKYDFEGGNAFSVGSKTFLVTPRALTVVESANDSKVTLTVEEYRMMRACVDMEEHLEAGARVCAAMDLATKEGLVAASGGWFVRVAEILGVAPGWRGEK